MSRHIFLALVSVFFFVAMVLALTPAARAETDARTLTGELYTLDLKAKTLTVKKADNSTVTLKFNKLTVIQRNGKDVKVKALALQDNITAKYKANLTATKISATGPKRGKVVGALTDALKGNGTVVIGTKTLKTNAQTRISRNGVLVSLSQLTRQDKIVAHVKTTALKSSSAESEASDLIADGPEDQELHGLISAISGNAVTITPSNGTADVTVNVTATTMIEVDSEHATLADLAVGMQVEAAYDPSTFDAYSIETDSDGEADDAFVNGTVAAVDTVAGTLTITPTAGSDLTLNVNASTEIEVNDVHGTLEDVQVGMPVSAEYDATTMLAKEIKAGAGDDNHEDTKIEGTVAAVDTSAGTVTITPAGGGSDVTLNVTTQTEIEVNDAPGTIADIQVAMPIRAEYDTASFDAFEIKAGTDDSGSGGGDDHAQVEGTISALDAVNFTVTIDAGAGTFVTVILTAQTEIKVDDEDATFADLVVGQSAKAEYNILTFEAHEIKAENP
ncbi:MAG: hypothetical protein HY741_28435 [Chloroflexi bacterium]|nr:hypothetical protein [Chloroflexota bacterium]